MNKSYKTWVSLVAVAVLAGPLVAFAWTPAPPSPPSSNIDAPINTGSGTQTKLGRVLFNANDYDIGLVINGSNSVKGKVGIGFTGACPGAECPTYKLHVGKSGDGSAVGASAFFYTSDSRLKNSIQTLGDSLDKILSLRGVSYNWNSTGLKDIGLIAQEVEKVYPEVVSTANDGMKSIDYGHLVGPLVEAIKAQQKQIAALEARIATLEAKAK